MEIEDNHLTYVSDAEIENGTFKIPKEVHYIDSYAFHCCRRLRKISIPANVRGIAGNAFRGCINLSTIEFPPTNADPRISIILHKDSFLIPETLDHPSPLKTVIITPDRKIDDRFRSYFPKKVNFVEKVSQRRCSTKKVRDEGFSK